MEIGNGVEQPKIDIGPRVAQTVEEPVTLAGGVFQFENDVSRKLHFITHIESSR